MPDDTNRAQEFKRVLVPVAILIVIIAAAAVFLAYTPSMPEAVTPPTTAQGQPQEEAGQMQPEGNQQVLSGAQANAPQSASTSEQLTSQQKMEILENAQQH